MKRKTFKDLRCFAIVAGVAAVGIITANAALADTAADETIRKADAFIEAHTTARSAEPETVSLSYEEWQEQQTEPETEPETVPETEPETAAEEPDIYSMDVWTLGSYLYGISELDTTRSLILISFEGYGPESPLSYYVACACWTRATNGYLGIGSGDLYTAFGGADTWNYGTWMDAYGWESYAEEALRAAYLDPCYVVGCNGCEIPESWIYEEGGIYVW